MQERIKKSAFYEKKSLHFAAIFRKIEVKCIWSYQSREELP